MGGLVSLLKGEQERRLLMVGLDNAGKKSLLHQLSLRLPYDEPGWPAPVGSVATFHFKNLLFNEWDLGGQDKVRPLWRHYYGAADGVVFVVDSNDRERIGLAADELQMMMGDDQLGTDVPLLVVANKQDVPNAMSLAEVTEQLGLHRMGMSMTSMKDRQWHVQATCATSGHGVDEAVDWLMRSVNG